jgi:L-aspartate oxidase
VTDSSSDRPSSARPSSARPSDAHLDILVLGSGVAGLSAAVRAAGREGLRVGVLTKAALDQSATRWAQGGIAAVVGGDEDSTDLHLADTLAAGAGLCDPDAVRVLVDEGPARVQDLIDLGADFDRQPEGGLARAREGGHSVARILHAGGAATGAEVERALVEAVRATAASVREGWLAVDLLVGDGSCRGVRAVDPAGVVHEITADHVVVATGGAGQMFAVTTNPSQSTGDGVAMALRAGVSVADLEFMQFHPTALHHPAMPRPLLSEALRGYGALLRDSSGERFVDELSPRDVVSRAMTSRMIEQGVDHMWLDATGLDRFDERFPTIAVSVRAVGLDPATDWLPIAPAAHYLSGGILTDLDGASSLSRLWACGEAACTGVHGANRLASNSLLEGIVFAPRVVEAIVAGRDGPMANGAMRATPRTPLVGPGATTGTMVAHRRVDLRAPAPLGWAADVEDPSKVREALQRAMTTGAGVLRTAESLQSTADAVSAILERGCGPAVNGASTRHPAMTFAQAELANLACVSWALLRAATERCESRGAHTRADHPEPDDAYRCRLVF